MEQSVSGRKVVRGKKLKRKATQYDFMVLFITILLVLFGIIMVFSSSYRCV